MIRNLASISILLAWSWQGLYAVDVSWNAVPGSSLHIAGNEAGRAWAIGVDRVSQSGFEVYSYAGGNWTKQAGAGRRITVDPSGRPWMVDEQSKIYRYDLNSSSWQLLPGSASDIAAGGDGSIWVLSSVKGAFGYPIFKWDQASQNWTSISGEGTRIAVEKSGAPWVVNENGDIFRYDPVSRSWSQKPGKARSVHTGLGSGTVWAMGTQQVVGGYRVSRFVPSTQTWEEFGSLGAEGITEVATNPWMVQSDGSIFSRAPEFTSSIIVTGEIITTPPTPDPQVQPPLRSDATGTTLCAHLGLTRCGDTKADYVGKYALDLSCDEGFYDPIYGGTCWKCPDDTDDGGAWIRAGNPVTNIDACWRVPKEKTGHAIKVKEPSLAWDCPAGSFHDIWPDIFKGGSCWKCPDALPRRTAAPVYASNACASSLNETRSAILLKFNGCPTPSATEMNLPGKRTPGKPFLDIAAGWYEGVASGGCYSCPIVDEAGNFLLTERNAAPIFSKDSNSACTIKLKWQPSRFWEPGLAYLQGVKDVIWEHRLFDTDRITGSLYDLAESKGYGDATPEAKAWVTARWQEIAKKPYNNESFRAIIFTLLKGALRKQPEQRTAAEKKLIQSFGNYIRDRRTYLAQQGLLMYDAWKTYDDQYRQQTGQTKSFSQLFYYGTVPLDFQGIYGSMMTLGGTGGGLIGSMAIASAFGTSVQAGSRGLFGLMGTMRILTTVQGLTALSGATVVSLVGIVVGAVANDQLQAIETARPRLVESLQKAKGPVDLDVLADSTNGEDQLYFYWSKAMDTTDIEDPQVVQLATSAQARAHQAGYMAPPKVGFESTSRKHQLSSGTGAVSPFASAGLTQGQELVSPSGKFRAVMQTDGNFVIYEGTRAIWATNTNGKAISPYRLAMQTDGNLVVYGSSNQDVTLGSFGVCRVGSVCIGVWASGPRNGSAPFTLTMQDDGNLVVYDNANRAVWASNTQR